MWRELEGALVRLIAWCHHNHMEITLASTQQCLKQFIDMQVRKITIEAIQRAVSENFGMRVSDLKQKNNSRNVVVPRQIAMYPPAKQMTEASLPEIGRGQFGNKHHTTVMCIPSAKLTSSAATTRTCTAPSISSRIC